MNEKKRKKNPSYNSKSWYTGTNKPHFRLPYERDLNNRKRPSDFNVEVPVTSTREGWGQQLANF